MLVKVGRRNPLVPTAALGITLQLNELQLQMVWNVIYVHRKQHLLSKLLHMLLLSVPSKLYECAIVHNVGARRY